MPTMSKTSSPSPSSSSSFSADFSSQPLSSPSSSGPNSRLSWLNDPASATPTPLGLRVIPHVGDWWSRTAQPGIPFEEKRADEAAPLLLLSPAPFACARTGDFDLEASLAHFHKRDYDQAGVCVRVSSTCWLKANVERMPDAEGGKLVLACAVTNNGMTDLSQQPLDAERCCCSRGGSGNGAGGIPGATSAIRLRVRRREGDYSVEWSPPPTAAAAAKEGDGGGDGGGGEGPTWTRYRLCRLHEDDGGADVVSGIRVGVYASAPVAPGFVALFRSLEVSPPPTTTPASRDDADDDSASRERDPDQL